MIIDFNNNLCELIDVFRKLIMPRKPLCIITSKVRIKINAFFSKHVTHFLTSLTFFKILTPFRVFMRSRISSNLN